MDEIDRQLMIICIFFAVFNAFSEKSMDETSASGKYFFSTNGMTPLPVPISRIFYNLSAWHFFISRMAISSNSSVSGRGISTFSSTKNFIP